MSDLSRFEQALVFANQVHASQYRKHSKIPYITHLMAVASLVGEYGGDEDQIIAGLLHDAPEDQGGLVQLQEINDRFGDRVARIVSGCTDTFDDPKPPWRPRKEAYVARIGEEERDVLLVSASDKLHNSTSTLKDLRHEGLAVFERFNGKQAGTLWYYQALVSAYRQATKQHSSPGFDRLVSDLALVVDELRRLAED